MRVFDSRKLLTVAVLVLLSTFVVSGAGSTETAVVKDVSFKPNGTSLEVRIASSSHAPYTYFELSSPHRLVVDFNGIQNHVGFKEKAIDAAGVSRVRASFFTDKTRKATRIVFDMQDNVPFKVSDDKAGNVTVQFGSDAVEPARPEATLVAGPPVVPAVTAPNAVARPLPMSVVVAPERPLAPQAPAAQVPPILAQNQLPQNYNGELVSFDVKDMDLKDFFRLIGSISGLNIVVDKAVTGTQTLYMTDVPWDQVLDVVLTDNNLGSQLQGNVLRIAPQATLQAEETARKTLKDAKEQITDLSTKTYILNYTKVDAVAATLGKMLSGNRASIVTDVRRNALIVSDLPTQFVKLDQLVKFLDMPAQQVQIEARILSANKGFSRELGSQLGVIFGNNSSNKLGGVPGVGNSPFSRTPPPSVTSAGSTALPLNVNLPAAGTSGISFLMGFGADIVLDEIITAAEARGTAKIISKPSVVTQNNQSALIQQGTQIPVQTSQNNTVSVQFINFSLQLNVTPQITDVGTILLTVAIENSAPDFAKAVNGIPSVSTQKANTQILIQDGGTAAIGGILVDTDTFNLRQVPGLGSIPIIGHFFKNTSVIKGTAELLFFITPRILSLDNLNILTTPPPAKGPGGDRK